MKDNFSKQAEKYVLFRPSYPPELFDFLIGLVEEKNCAWDCGTGNGQVALALSKYFKIVYATDISEKQLENAFKSDNIVYEKCSAEDTTFENDKFDLVTVAQAIHWFDFEKFYSEVRRTIKTRGVLAVIGYALPVIDKFTDPIIHNFYSNILGEYWDPERKFIDENYTTIPFPFDEIETPEFDIKVSWSFEMLIGYLESWSAVQHYYGKNNINPIEKVVEELRKNWLEGSVKEVRFPVLLRITRFGK